MEKLEWWTYRRRWKKYENVSCRVDTKYERDRHRMDRRTLHDSKGRACSLTVARQKRDHWYFLNLKKISHGCFFGAACSYTVGYSILARCSSRGDQVTQWSTVTIGLGMSNHFVDCCCCCCCLWTSMDCCIALLLGASRCIWWSADDSAPDCAAIYMSVCLSLSLSLSHSHVLRVWLSRLGAAQWAVSDSASPARCDRDIAQSLRRDLWHAELPTKNTAFNCSEAFGTPTTAEISQ